ncbi:MAG: helix-turn-helix domain-containing protein [Oscillospiraceae bacterium]|nr:helix-turn-helix domain-containing protein [Oscillospiraceae bacterium]
MSVFRVEKNRNYTAMCNYHLRDMNLSNKARGLLSTMLSLPEDWDYTTRGLARICKDGVESITTQLKELEKCGYLERHQTRGASGRLQNTEFVIYEIPRNVSLQPYPSSPYTGNPYTEKPYTENPAQLNKDIQSKDKRSTVFPSIPSDEPKRSESNPICVRAYRSLVRENIEYDRLVADKPFDRDRLEEILELIVEIVCSTSKYIHIAKSDTPTEIVQSRFLKLNADHIVFVLDCLKENTTQIRNMKQYLLTTLYNAPVTIGNYYASLVQHDLENKYP